MGALDRDGFCIVPNVLGDVQIARLIDVLDAASITRSRRGEDFFGARNLLAIPEIRALAHAPQILDLVQPILGSGAKAVRGIFFDKTQGANWPVAWHQDLTLAVGERRDIPGWTNWSVKGGVHHVQPPVCVLQKMLTLRIMLDDCGPDNGPLRVLPGSHALGRLTREQITDLRASTQEQECLGEAGDVLVMRPLLLHASSAANNPHHRRVIHLEYAAADDKELGVE